MFAWTQVSKVLSEASANVLQGYRGFTRSKLVTSFTVSRLEKSTQPSRRLNSDEDDTM